MDTVGIALIVVVVVIAIVVAALLHERSQVAMDRRRAEYARARQVYEARKAIILANHAAALEAARTGVAPVVARRQPAMATAAAVEQGGAIASDEAIDAFLDDGEQDATDDAAGDGGRSTLTRRERKALRRYEQDRVPDWVHRPLRPGEDPATPWWVRLRATVGLAVMVGLLGVGTAGCIGAVFLAAGLMLEKFAG